MIKIECLCEKITNYISEELNLNYEKKSVVNYGIFAFIQMGISILLIIILGLFFNVVPEALIISFTVSILRKSSGGAHANSPESCAIIGTVISIGSAIILIKIYVNLPLFILSGIIIFIWSFYTVNKLAPVDSIAKPIKNIEKRQRLKRSSIRILSLYIITLVINYVIYLYSDKRTFLTYSLCIYIGTLWQVFSLTKRGHDFYRYINKFL